MKRFPIAGRLSMAFGLACALYGASPKPAMAGTWEPVTPTTNWMDAEPGNAAYEEWSQTIQGAGSGTWNFDWLPYFWADHSYIWDFPVGDAAFLQHKGRFGGRFRWVPDQIWDSGTEKYIDDPNDTVPPKVVFKMTGHATAGAWPGEGVPIGKAKATASIMGVDFPSVPYNENMWHGGTVMGAGGNLTKFLVKNTNGATEITAPWVSVLAKAEVEGNREETDGSPAMGQIDVSVMGGVEIVDRGVFITSSLGQTFRKSTSQPIAGVGETPLPPISGSNPPVWKEPVPDGEPAHTAATWYGSEHPSGLHAWVGGARFYAQTPGITTPDYSWDPSGGNPKSLNGLTNSELHLNFQPSFNPQDPSHTGGFKLGTSIDGSDLTKSSDITLDVIDMAPSAPSDTLSDTYTVKWHLPHEWEGSAYKKDPPIWDSVEATTIIRNSASAAGSVLGRWRWRNFFVGALLNSDEGNVFDLAGTLSSDPVQALFYKACGIYGQQFSDQDQTDQDGNFQTIWDSTFNNDPATSATWPGTRPKNPDGSWDNSDDTKAEYLLTNPRMLKKYQIEYWRADVYGASGFEGVIRRPIRKRIPGTWITGDFILDNGSGSGGE